MKIEDGKSKNSKKSLIAALDIGTTKSCYIIAEKKPEGLDVVGIGSAPNLGMRQGAIVNIESTVQSIQKAREEAELMAGFGAESAWVSVGGTYVESFESDGMVAIRDREVSQEDVRRVLDAARAVAIPADRMVLHVLPNGYSIDKQSGIYDPIGMAGVRLEASVHIITGNSSSIQNIVKCCGQADIKVEGLVLQQLASSKAVITEDERSLGVCVVDIGGGTCDLISYKQGHVVHTSTIPVGGNNFTHDIAMGLRTTQNDAEDMKRKSACVVSEMINENELIQVEGVGGRESRAVEVKHLCEIVEARAEEVLCLIRGAIEDAGLTKKLGSGVVLTGGGSSLRGLVEMGEFLYDIPVRQGMPVLVGGLTDIVRSSNFATCVGLLMYGLEKQNDKLSSKYSEESFNDKILRWARRTRDYVADSIS